MVPSKQYLWAWKFLIVVIWIIATPAFGSVEPDADVASSTAVYIDYNKDNQIAKLSQSWPNASRSMSRLGIRYNQPIIQPLVYNNQHAGPTGNYIMPGSRQLNSRMEFFIKTADQEIIIKPTKDQQVNVDFLPNKIKEKWLFKSGLEMTRKYYQPPNSPTTIIRFNIKNNSSKKISGFRLKTTIINPELNDRQTRLEQDDELYADPRNGLLFLRDTIRRDESWVAIAWAPSSGLISSGNQSTHDYQSRRRLHELSTDLHVTLETPVIDLEKGQSLTTELLITWGSNKDVVSEQIQDLRKKSEYDFWLGTIHYNHDKTFNITCQDPYITYILKVMQAWSKHQFVQKKEGSIIWGSSDTSKPAQPQDVYRGIRSFLAFGNHEVVKNYIDSWLDKRQESPDAVYIIQMIYDYITFTQDLKWLKANAFRIEDLLNYIYKLDDDQDGLPNFLVLWEPYGMVQPDEPIYHVQQTDLQLFEYSLASIIAYRHAIELFELIDTQRHRLIIKKYQALIQKATTVLVENYWDSQLGKQGFYSFGRLDDRDMLIHKQHISAIECYLKNVGQKINQQAVFQECWSSPDWINENGFYKSFHDKAINENDLFPVNDKQYSVDYTHMMIDAALKTTTTAKQAYEHFKDYSKMLCTHPAILALPADYNKDSAAMSFSSLSYIDIVLRHLGGIDISSKGVIIRKLNSDQVLDLTINNLKLHKKNVTFKVSKIKKGATKLRINGKKRSFNQLINLNQYKEQELLIEADYSSLKKINKKKKRRNRSTKKIGRNQRR